MTDPATPCAAGRQVVIDGVAYDLIPYGEEADYDGQPFFTKPCRVCGVDAGEVHKTACPLGAGLPYRRRERCRDCGVAVGQIHVLTCGIEQCPAAGTNTCHVRARATKTDPNRLRHCDGQRVRVRIHRGAHEIGGSCVEVEPQGQRFVLDVGRPLNATRDALIPSPISSDSANPTRPSSVL